MKDYISVVEAAALWGVSKRRVQVLCKEGRVPGAKMVGNIWIIPNDTDKPKALRPGKKIL